MKDYVVIAKIIKLLFLKKNQQYKISTTKSKRQCEGIEEQSCVDAVILEIF